jgi:ABC-type phosphate transport system substrate-binding protein
MRETRIGVALLVLLALGLAPSRSSRAGGGDGFVVIVHPANPSTTVERGFLQAAYLNKVPSWSDGTAIVPVDLRSPVRERFTRAVLKKTPQQLKRYWSQQIFSGKGVPPPEADSPAAVITFVLAHPGAVGYLPAGVDSGGARVVPLD